METSDVPPESKCPSCGKRFEQADTLLQAVSSKPGDFGVCISCAAILRYGPRLRMRLATAAQIESLPAQNQRELATIQAGMRVMKAARN